ncbi:hypothetical protein K1719_030730 [Acacia pycnantha]|nr:hypothetical protein K1719_030730 [Acacia pycnantha]
MRRTSSLEITSDDGFSKIIRIAALPNSENPNFEKTLDRFSSCYLISGDAALEKPYRVEYTFQKKRSGDCLLTHFISSFFLKQKAIVPFFTISSIEASMGPRRRRSFMASENKPNSNIMAFHQRNQTRFV